MDKENIENIYKHFHYRFFKFSILPAFLGLLLICTPHILNYHDTSIILSNRICGLLLILLASLSFIHRSVLWLGVFIGIWEILFPCLLHCSATVFANDTLLGFAIFATVCIPPIRPDPLEVGPTLPEGTSYNPSSGGRRAAVLIFSLLGWLQARYLTASTLGITLASYAPAFFIYPTIMTAYALLVVLTLSGGERRWHTRPKIVIIVAVTLLTTMIMTLLLSLLQRLCPENWLCLTLTIQPALASVFAYDELRATLAYLSQFSKKKADLVRIALFGSEFYKESLFWEERTVLPFSKACKQAFLGISFPINQILSIFLAIACMKFGYGKAFSEALRNYISMCCWFITVLSILSFAESLRYLRWFCLIFSSAILLSPVFFHIPLTSPYLVPIIILGIILIILPIGKIQQGKKL